MSEIKVNSIKGVGASAAAITVNNSDGTCTANITSVNGGQLGNRNLLINGDMQISQRNGSSSVTYTNGQYSLDRWHIVADAASKFSTQQVSDAPSGLKKSLKMTSSSAYTPQTNEAFGVGQKIEGHNTNWLGFGASGAKSITISFFVKSSLTGTFSGSVLNENATRGYPWSYTISSADTWERKTITVTGSPDGSWSTSTGTGLWIFWSMGANANRSGTAGQWSTSQYTFAVTGSTAVVATNGATLQITGCQVEEGSVATDFEHRSFGQELALCQRYFYMHASGAESASNTAEIPIGLGYGYTNVDCYVVVKYPVTMRTNPSIFKVVGSNYFRFAYNNNNAYPDDVGFNRVATNSAEIFFGTNASWGQNDGGMVRINDSAARLGFNAEL